MLGMRVKKGRWRAALIGPMRKMTSMKMGMTSVSSMGPLRAR